MKRYLAAAARKDRRSLGAFIIVSALARAAELMDKEPPQPRDCRRKAAA